MADIPPDTDVTTERNHSRAGGEDQQQSAVPPPPPRDTVAQSQRPDRSRDTDRRPRHSLTEAEVQGGARVTRLSS